MKTFAYFDTGHEFPEEIVMAAGFAPVKILGDVHRGTAAADEYLFSYFCPFARGCLSEALANAGRWAGIGFAHGCDATNRHFDVWKAHIKNIPFFWVNTPMKADKTAQTFYRKELERFIENLQSHYAVTVGRKELQEAIGLSNEIKSMMRRLAALRPLKDIPNRDYFQMTRMAVESPKASLPEQLTLLLQDWESRKPYPSEKLSVVLTGSDVTFPEWMDVLDDAGFRVVRDDLSLGERYFASAIPEMADPLEALVAYFCGMPGPATRVPSDARMDYLIKALGETGVDAIVSQNMKFCEVYAMDAVWTVAGLKDRGYPVIHLERDYTTADDRQLLTRLEAFREIIQQKEERHHAQHA